MIHFIVRRSASKVKQEKSGYDMISIYIYDDIYICMYVYYTCFIHDTVYQVVST
jgi:hypothetical protein